MRVRSAPSPHFKGIPQKSQYDAAAVAVMHSGHSELPPLDVRIAPLLFVITYWCGLALVYAFMAYVIAMSATWRGPVIVWALLIPTAVFSLWRHLPSERRLVEAKSAEVILLRCGGFYTLAESDSWSSYTEVPEALLHQEPLPTRPTNACAADGGAITDTIVARR
ncbi:unspecified product [Leishmania tarentolae]|uniref:Unspecified product n=1 Tax=Leishmania tarentolae TaxID=5689 RepID=A0A640KM77_LEITA|nr:unspecified product [Leishmania tarentolae]